MRFVLLRTRLLTRTLGPVPAIALLAWLVLVALGGPANAAAADLQTAGSLCVGLLPIAVASATVAPNARSGRLYLYAASSLIIYSMHAAVGCLACWLLSCTTRDVAAQPSSLLAASLVFFPPVAMLAGISHVCNRWGIVTAAVLAFFMQCILFAPSLDWHTQHWLSLAIELAAVILLLPALRPVVG